MGYTTDFNGAFRLSKPATEKQKNYINGMSNTRRIKRDVNILMQKYKGKFGHPTPKGNTPEEIYGVDGEFYVNENEKDDYGQGNDKSIIDYNTPPGQPDRYQTKDMDWRESYTIKQSLIGDGKCVPGLWCQWVIEEPIPDLDTQDLTWDGGEKFYEYIPWLKYYIKNFFEPWGIKLNGEIYWAGEDHEDMGKIEVADNVITIKVGKVVYG